MAKKVTKTTKKVEQKEKSIWDKNQQGVRIDLGCGEQKSRGFIGVDFREAPGVDVVQDLTKFPWTAIPDEVAFMVVASHVLEHINPDSPSPQLKGLIDLLLKKKTITKAEVEEFVGEYDYLGGFVRFMDEVWRILKPEGQFAFVVPYGGNHSYFQDPTHVNPINEITLAYFDPLARNAYGQLHNAYTIYRPLPWKIVSCSYAVNGILEVLLEKRAIDKSYHTASAHGMDMNNSVKEN